MSRRIRRAVDALLTAAADRETCRRAWWCWRTWLDRRAWRGTGSRKRLIALLVPAVILAALLGFAQLVAAEVPNQLPGQFDADAYSALVNFGQSNETAEPNLNLVAAERPNPADDVYHPAQRGSAHARMAGEANLVTADAFESFAKSGADDEVFSALVKFAQQTVAAEPNLVVAQAAPPAGTMPPAATIKKPSPVVNEGGYAKDDPKSCLEGSSCHAKDPPVVAFLKESPMAVKGDPQTPMAQVGCQSCHGPSAAHVVASRAKGGFKAGVDEPAIVFKGPNASPVPDRNAVCQSCHVGGLLINWEGSMMERAGVACTDCHSIMASEDVVRVKKTQAEVCFACHAEQRADSYKYSHHPIREGKVVCSDCHNPMGGPGPHMLKEFSVNETCYNCHADKRGPMLWEHQPVREDCTNCHTPHGSSEQRLMKESMGFMCSSCHSAVSNNSGGAFGGGHALFGNLQGKALFNSALGNQRLCLNCHSQIHGSNSPNGAYFFR